MADNLAFPGQIPFCNLSDMSEIEFYIHLVTKMQPCIMKNYSKSWPAFTKWKDRKYLLEKIGNEMIEVEQKEDTNFAAYLPGYLRINTTYERFITKMERPNR